MEWIIISLLGLGLVLFVGIVIILRSKQPKRGHLPDRFDFTAFKARELSNRGVYDRTKW